MNFKKAWHFLTDPLGPAAKWQTVPAGRCPCHRGQSFCIIRDNLVLEICGVCLQSYMWENGFLLSNPMSTPRVCSKCNQRKNSDSYITSKGERTSICYECRQEWARKKRKEIAKQAELHEFEMEAARRDLLDRVNRLGKA